MSDFGFPSNNGELIYFDGNSTTTMPENVIKSMLKWMNHGNPSSSYTSAQRCREMMDEFRKYIADKCNFTADLGGDIKSNSYKIIFTSGASESNAAIIRECCDSFFASTGKLPHVIISAIEHKSIILLAEYLEKKKLAIITYVKPNNLGFIEDSAVAAAIKPNTCLVCVMSANNETGGINNLSEISKVCRRRKPHIPLYTDCAQSFGKYLIDPEAMGVDAFCASFHKLYGPPGVGILVIKSSLIAGYNLGALICGTQNAGLRGGTENIPGIAGAFEAMRFTLKDRINKNKKLMELKRRIIEGIRNEYPCKSYSEYMNNKTSPCVVFISTASKDYLCNTLLLSVVNNNYPVCNTDIKNGLTENRIIVSIGSACNTASPLASHVLYAMNVDDFIRRGTLRISLVDWNTEKECDYFIRIFTELIADYMKETELEKNNINQIED